MAGPASAGWCESVRATSLSWANGADAVNFTYGAVSLVVGGAMVAALALVRLRRARAAARAVYGGGGGGGGDGVGADMALILPVYFNIVAVFALGYVVQGVVEVTVDVCVRGAGSA